MAVQRGWLTVREANRPKWTSGQRSVKWTSSEDSVHFVQVRRTTPWWEIWPIQILSCPSHLSLLGVSVCDWLSENSRERNFLSARGRGEGVWFFFLGNYWFFVHLEGFCPCVTKMNFLEHWRYLPVLWRGGVKVLNYVLFHKQQLGNQ